MGRGSAPQGGPGNYGSSKSAKPKKPRNVARSFKVKSGVADQPEEAASDSTPAFTVTRPSRERRAELLRAQRSEKAAAAKLAALARKPVNGTSPGGELLGGNIGLDAIPSAEKLREARLQHLEKKHLENVATQAQASSQIGSQASSSSSSVPVNESSSVLLSEQERRQALEDLLRQPIVDSWQQSASVTDSAEDESEVDIRDAELHVLVAFLLDTLADRLGPVEVAKGIHLLQTVLGNVTKDDPKYRRLRASNAKLWAGLLQHPELCMVLEVAGFQQSTEERDRCAELKQVELAVQELLENNEHVDETKVDGLLHRMTELKNGLDSSATCGDIGSTPDNLVGHSTTFLHAASEQLLGDLAVVSEAVAEWTPLSTEEMSPAM